MPTITVIGWYGTETIGDRAILAGLFSLFSQAYPDFRVHIGSIFPFLTERTILEDYDLLRICSGKDILSISIFNSIEARELRAAIKKSDILVVGGGPLFDGYCVFMLEYALKYAKKIGKKTMVLGCGVGPLYKKRFIKSVISTINHSDVCVFRDEKSKGEYDRFSGLKTDTVSAIDPAVFAAEAFRRANNDIVVSDERIVANIIRFPLVYKINSGINESTVNQTAISLLNQVSEESGKKILLVPMHYFKVGGDDRIYMNKLKFGMENGCIEVQNEPLSTAQTMRLFASTYLCFGMRFHSILLQTLLCGRNIVIDYTDPQTGKTGNFLHQINACDFYSNRYVNLQVGVQKLQFDSGPNRFIASGELIQEYKDIYCSKMIV